MMSAAPPSLCLSVLMPSAQSRKVLQKTGGTTKAQVVINSIIINLFRKNCAKNIWDLKLAHTSCSP